MYISVRQCGDGYLFRRLVYRYEIPHGETDPVLEVIGYPIISRFTGVESRYALSRYYVIMEYDSSERPIVGIRTKGVIPHISIARLFHYIMSNPLTRAGDFKLATIISRELLPGPGLIPIAHYTDIVYEPDIYRPVYPEAITAACLDASRRGFDLLITYALNTLYSLKYIDEESVRISDECVDREYSTISCILQTVIAKSKRLIKPRSDILLTTRRQPAFKENEVQTLEQRINHILDKVSNIYIIDREIIKTLLNTDEFKRALFGKYIESQTNILIHTRPDKIIHETYTRLVKKKEEEVGHTRKPILVDVTGQYNLLDLAIASYLAGNNPVYLLATPETYINILSIIKTLKYRNKKVKEKKKDKLHTYILDIGLHETTITPLIIPSTITPHKNYHLEIYKKLEEKHGEIIYWTGHPPYLTKSLIEYILRKGKPFIHNYLIT